jgi:hypothetical protein
MCPECSPPTLTCHCASLDSSKYFATHAENRDWYDGLLKWNRKPKIGQLSKPKWAAEWVATQVFLLSDGEVRNKLSFIFFSNDVNVSRHLNLMIYPGHKRRLKRDRDRSVCHRPKAQRSTLGTSSRKTSSFISSLQRARAANVLTGRPSSRCLKGRLIRSSPSC